MIALIQRVESAEVRVGAQVTGAIEAGILALIGVRRDDDERSADTLLERVLGYRIFPDAEERMNRSLRDVQGGLLVVPQFTLAADTRSGTRAGFSVAADPASARRLFEYLVTRAQRGHARVASGVFGAHMRVSLVNDGPVTFWLESRGSSPGAG